MKLAAFINAHVEEIVEEFVAFASTLEPASLGNSVAELRDHARGILLTIAADLSLRESAKQLHDKAVGDLPPANGPESAAAARGAAVRWIHAPATDCRIHGAAGERIAAVVANAQA